MNDPVPFLRKPPEPKPRRRPPILRWLIPILALLVLLSGYIPTSTGPASGGGLGGSTIRSTTRPTLKVATFNIHSGRNSAGQFNLDRTAKVLKNYDLVALNEVRGSLSQGEDQAALLGQKLNMQFLFVPTEYQWWHASFGNGLLCAVPVAQWKREPLPSGFRRGKRNLLTLRIIFQGRPITVMITHIDRGEDRTHQLRQVIDEFLKASPPAVLMGDFNSPATDPEIERARSSSDVKDFAPKIPLDNIDWIFVRGLNVIDGGIEDNDASDHPLLWAELKLP